MTPGSRPRAAAGLSSGTAGSSPTPARRTHMASTPALSRLRAADLLGVGTLGLRSRRLRAVLSSLGIAIGVGAIVGILGITRSSQSSLLAELNQLGTNILTVTSGQSATGQEAELPVTATEMIRRAGGVLGAAPTAQLATASVYLTQFVPSGQTGGLAVRACDTTLLPTLGTSVWRGWFLNAATERYPVTVLGYEAAKTLGITSPGERVWLGGHWFTVSGILNPLPLEPEVDRSALIGFAVAASLFGYDGHPSRIYVRAAQDQVTAVAGLLAPAANPAGPRTRWPPGSPCSGRARHCSSGSARSRCWSAASASPT